MTTQITFGTASDCTIRILDDPYVSLWHASIVQDDGGRYWVRDLGSANGTWLVRAGAGRMRVSRAAPLRAGDVIRVGSRTWIPWPGVPA